MAVAASSEQTACGQCRLGLGRLSNSIRTNSRLRAQRRARVIDARIGETRAAELSRPMTPTFFEGEAADQSNRQPDMCTAETGFRATEVFAGTSAGRLVVACHPAAPLSDGPPGRSRRHRPVAPQNPRRLGRQVTASRALRTSCERPAQGARLFRIQRRLPVHRSPTPTAASICATEPDTLRPRFEPPPFRSEHRPSSVPQAFRTRLEQNGRTLPLQDRRPSTARPREIIGHTLRVSEQPQLKIYTALDLHPAPGGVTY